MGEAAGRPHRAAGSEGAGADTEVRGSTWAEVARAAATGAAGSADAPGSPRIDAARPPRANPLPPGVASLPVPARLAVFALWLAASPAIAGLLFWQYVVRGEMPHVPGRDS